MAQKYYSVMTKNGIDIVNDLLYEDTETLFTNGWNISLGTGNLEPTSDTTELINPILDKNSEDYPDITFGKHEIYGHYAEITIPESIKGNILTECGLFNDEDILIAVSKIHLDLTETMLDDGIDLTAKQRIYIQAVPATTHIIYTPQGDLINKELLDLELRNYQKLNEKGIENGYCELDENAKIPLVNIPSSITNVDLSNLSATGESHFVKPDIAVTHTVNTSIGSSSQPIYVNSSGGATVCNGLSISSLCATSQSNLTGGTQTKPAVVKEHYQNGTSWYRIWSDGWIEQGGFLNTTLTTISSGKYQGVISFIKQFSNTNYTFTAGIAYTSVVTANNCPIFGVSILEKGRISMDAYTSLYQARWYACGY